MRKKRGLFLRKIENMKKIHRRKVCHNHAKKDDGRKKRFEWLPRILSLSESDAFKEDGSVSRVSLSVSPSVFLRVLYPLREDMPARMISSTRRRLEAMTAQELRSCTFTLRTRGRKVERKEI